MVVPDASELETLYMGDHMAYCATAILMVVALLVIIFFVRDRRRGAQVTPAEQGQELTDYSAGFDGVTVDGTYAETLDEDRQYVAADVMNRQPVCVRNTDSMAQVIRLLNEDQTSGLPVVDEKGALVGFVSDGDVAAYLGKTEISVVDTTLNMYRYIDDERAVSRLKELMNLNVMAVATPRVISVDTTTPVEEVCGLFASKRIKKVPVVHEGKLVGTLSRRNIMSSLVDAIRLLEEQA